jgi:hypothetical protein
MQKKKIDLKDLTKQRKTELKLLEKAKKSESQFKKVYRVPIPQGYKYVPAEYFRARRKKLLEMATGPIKLIKK